MERDALRRGLTATIPVRSLGNARRHVKVVIPGGTGQVGAALIRALGEAHEIVVLTRTSRAIGGARAVEWDAKTLGAWSEELDGADAVINLAGRSVNCRYTDANLREMYDSRIDSARAVGAAISEAKRPPAVWLQMSTATIYAHQFDAPNDESTGVLGGSEPGVPAYWSFSIEIARDWERAQQEADTPRTRKVAMRTAMVMSPDRGGVFDTLAKMTRLGLGGAIAGGRQYVSWIHERDFVSAVLWLIERRDLAGVVNLAAPHPIPQREFQAQLRAALGTRIGLPATKWMAEIGAFALRTDTELLLKSRRVVPGRLAAARFGFEFVHWSEAARELAARWR
jgi:uncharacterized protein